MTGGMTCAGQLSPLALPQDTNQPVVQAPALKTKPEAAAVPKEDWTNACFSSFRDSSSSFSLPISSWQLPPGSDGTSPSGTVTGFNVPHGEVEGIRLIQWLRCHQKRQCSFSIK